MKKTILFIAICLLSTIIKAQELKTCGEVEYVQSTHFSRDFSRDFILRFNNDESIYKETNITEKKEKIEQTNKDEGQELIREISRNNLNPEFFYNDRESFHFMQVWFDKELLVKEDSLAWRWDLKDEVRKIGAFNCQKANIKFRGREYTAWFTNEIPVPFGPWKFQGLPGLILEVYDKDKVFHIVAKKVEIEKQDKCEIKVDSLKFQEALTIKQYLKKKVELIKDDFAKLSSRLPKGYGPLVYDEDCDDCREEIELFKNEQ